MTGGNMLGCHDDHKYDSASCRLVNIRVAMDFRLICRLVPGGITLTYCWRFMIMTMMMMSMLIMLMIMMIMLMICEKLNAMPSLIQATTMIR